MATTSIFRTTPLTLVDGQETALQCDSDGSLYINIRETTTGVLTDRSGTIAAANTAQQLMAANPSRKGFLIQNNSAATLWFNEIGGTAVTSQPSISLAAGALYNSPTPGGSNQAVSIIGGTLGQAFTAREW